MIEQIQKERFLSFRSDGVMYYEVNVDHRQRLLQSSAFKSNSSLLTKRERYVGYVTDGVRKRMRKAITLLLQSTPWKYSQHPVSGRTITHKISFITLTTPDTDLSRDAKFCHKMLLEPMLRYFRRKFDMKSYIWKCELQNNGQVHYHVTTDFMAHHEKIREHWNGLLRQNGMLDKFKEKYGHDNPNSTDIHSVHKVNNLESYLVKYICKEYQNEVALSGKVWDCSKNLKKADYFKLHLDTPIHDYIRELQKSLQVVTFYFEKAIYIKFCTSDYYSYFSNNVIQQFSIHLNNIREWVNNTKSQIGNYVNKLTTSSRTSMQKHRQLALNYYPNG